jgi:lysylphosphatidylglycerol synthetase-like protein (DUF2156 family)
MTSDARAPEERVAVMGREPLSPFLLGPDRDVVELPTGGVTGVRRIGRYAVMATEPAAPPGTEDATLDALLDFLARRDLLPVFAGVADAEPFRRRGLLARPMLDEAIVRLADFSLAGKRRANIRHSVSTARRFGLEVVPFEPALAEGVGAVSRQWLDRKWGGEFSFTMGRLDAQTVRRCNIRVALDRDGRVVGFVTWYPCDDGRGCVLDLMRRVADAPNPTVDLLVADGLAEHAERGVEWAGLGSVPRSPGPWTERLYASASLRFYKDKFAPEWRELHTVVPSWRRSVGGSLALFRASAPPNAWRTVTADAWGSIRSGRADRAATGK